MVLQSTHLSVNGQSKKLIGLQSLQDQNKNIWGHFANKKYTWGDFANKKCMGQIANTKYMGTDCRQYKIYGDRLPIQIWGQIANKKYMGTDCQ